MRINEYKNLEEFKQDFEYPKTGNYEMFWGLDFSYNGNIYRLGLLDYVEGGEKRVEFERMLGYSLDDYLFEVLIEKPKKQVSKFICDEYNIIGWYKDIDDLLKNCLIDGRPFKDVIMDANTEILGKD